jgi:RNA recognition motif-containing protein
MKLYVGNLSYDTTETDLQDAFEQFGAVTDVKIMMDNSTGRSRGFGFVTMGSNQEGEAAMAGLHSRPLSGRNLTVNEARPREEQPRRSFDGPPRRSYGGGGGGGGGYGGGGGGGRR